MRVLALRQIDMHVHGCSRTIVAYACMHASNFMGAIGSLEGIQLGSGEPGGR
jgi:hypothetical protein